MKFPEAKLIPLDQIKPYPGNAKQHPQSQIDLLVKQISEGFDQPIVVDKNMTIIKGHGRRLACLEMGLKEVPVIVRDDLTPQQVKAARIADNKLAETDWDMELLAQELQALVDEGYGLSDLEAMGFDEPDINDLLSGFADDLVRDDDEPDEYSSGEYNANYGDDDVPESSVRMAQLFLDTKTHPLFIEMTDKLNEIYSTDNPTDCVMAGLRELCQNHSIELENG